MTVLAPRPVITSDGTMAPTLGWADPVERLHVRPLRAPALNLNVEGRQVTGPLQGFGSLWQKTYRVRLAEADVMPAHVMRVWREHFAEFWPRGNRFCPSVAGIAPGEVAILNMAMPGGVSLSTGMLVIYADDESFTLMSPEGHFEAGWITFSAFEDGGVTIVQIQSLARTNDPLYEIGFLLFGHAMQECFWQATLRSLAAHFGVKGEPWLAKSCLDQRWQWSAIWNTWQNAGVRTALYQMTTPLRKLRKLLT